jgi:hypothetical protein
MFGSRVVAWSLFYGLFLAAHFYYIAADLHDFDGVEQSAIQLTTIDLGLYYSLGWLSHEVARNLQRI